ncbi:MAG: hypothetical protein GX022_09265 [Clostridiaceae bacterium]|nr:hypothetical protein [Clostridiaceae bacterium]
MYTIVCDIVKDRMEKDFNEALRVLGLMVSSIKFENKLGLNVVLELSMNTEDENIKMNN